MIDPKYTLYIDDNMLGDMWMQAIKDGADSHRQDTHGYANQHEWQIRCFAEAVAARLSMLAAPYAKQNASLVEGIAERNSSTLTDQERGHLTDAAAFLRDAQPNADLIEAKEAMERAKAVPMWDNLPRALHRELDAVFRALNRA